MADIQALASEIGSLFLGVAKSIYGKFSQDDKDALTQYAKNVATLTAQLKIEKDPGRRAQIQDNLKTFENAMRLMVARYELIAANELEKAEIAALNIAISTLIKILIAAL